MVRNTHTYTHTRRRLRDRELTTTTRVSRRSAAEQCGRVTEGFKVVVARRYLLARPRFCPTVSVPTVTHGSRGQNHLPSARPDDPPSLATVTRCSTSAAAVPLYWSNLTCEVSPSVCGSGGRQWLSRLRSSVSAVNNRDTSAWLLRPLARGLVTTTISRRNWASKYEKPKKIEKKKTK